MRKQVALIATLLLSVPVTAQEWDAPVVAPDAQAPMIGLDGPDMDACGGVGRILSSGFNPEAGQVIFGAPDGSGEQLADLPNGSLVWLCEGAGDWQGIVYPTGDFQDLGDCRVSSPVAEPRAYDGPCEAGWVPATSILLTAG